MWIDGDSVLALFSLPLSQHQSHAHLLVFSFQLLMSPSTQDWKWDMIEVVTPERQYSHGFLGL